MLAKRRLPEGRLNFGTVAGDEFAVFIWRQVDAASNQVDFGLFPGNQNVENTFCFGFAAQALADQVGDAVVTNIHAVSHRRLPR